jgi:hypothetical protein
VTDEAALWHRLAGLLPPEEAQCFVDSWDIGEQEGGLQLLVSTLLEHHTQITGNTRVHIAVLAESWGIRESLQADIDRCARRAPADDAVRLIEPGNASVPGASVGGGVELAQLILVPWIACARCDRVLARAHSLEPWGELSYLPGQYVVFSSGPSTTVDVFAPEAVWDALAALRVCGGSAT